MSKSKKNLMALVEYLNPGLIKQGFVFQPESNAYSSGGEFANGFFTGKKIKIGLIYRQDRLGSVNYETQATNISHDMLFMALGKETEKRLLYDHNEFTSYTLMNESIQEALLRDLEDTVLPYFIKTPIEAINSMMLTARKNMW